MSRKVVSNRCTPKREDKLVEVLHDGVSFSQACRACKVPRKTDTYWRDQDPNLTNRSAIPIREA